MNMKQQYKGVNGFDILFVCDEEMKNIVVARQKMCYNLKRAIVLQGALTSF